MNVFEILGIADAGQLISGVARLAVAAFCGAIIGFERERRRRPAGLRTHMLVCLGAALVMITGEQINANFPSSDVARLGAQVVSGIGFLGAGTILVDRRDRIRGLTTAAGLWTSACIGLAIGSGYYLGGVLACVFTLIIVIAIRAVEKRFFKSESILDIYIEFNSLDALYPMLSQLNGMGYKVIELEVSGSEGGGARNPSVNMAVKLPVNVKTATIPEAVFSAEGITYIKIKR